MSHPEPFTEVGNRDPDFEEFVGAFMSHGVELSENDLLQAGRVWISITPAERRAAVQWARDQAIGEWRTREHARYIPRPLTVLRDRHWTRKSPGRVIRPITRGEQSAAQRNGELEKWAMEG
ncbi:MAG: hypothetical protein R2762_02170 [Bryobacteraceae bacterium]